MKDLEIKDSVYSSIISFCDNHLDEKEALELINWLGEDAENISHFRAIVQIWLASGLMSKKNFDSEVAWLRLSERLGKSDNSIKHYRIISFRLRNFIAYAAAILLLIVVGTGALLLSGKKNNVKDLGLIEAVAPKGSRSIITLADGSIVWLNSDTRIRYKQDFGNNSREIYLEGEAFFHVANNKTIPFRVNTSDILITALGTSFNVKAYNDENVIETTLESGEIKIDQIDPDKSQFKAATVYLKPNQKAVFSRESKNLAIDETGRTIKETQQIRRVGIKPVPILIDTLVDTKLSTSWKDNKWIFRKEKLIKLKPILERRYDISIVFKDSSLCNYKFTGTIKEESLDQVLKAVSLAAPIKYSIEHSIVTLTEDPDQKTRFMRNLIP